MKEFSICEKTLSANHLEDIRSVIKEHWDKGRSFISRMLCERWDWRYAHGHLRDMQCRSFLLGLERGGIIKLPPRLKPNNNKSRKPKVAILEDGKMVFQLEGGIEEYDDLELKLVSQREEEALWNSLIHQYHYQGCRFVIGSYLKYLVFLKGMAVGCLGWGSAAWKVKCRDDFIGWTTLQRRANLFSVVNNVRFLLLPRIRNLASKVLSRSIKSLSQDWERIHRRKIFLLETFIERGRFSGGCYKASNWLHVGATKGSAKRGQSYHYHGIIKDVYVYPLRKNFRNLLKQEQ